MTMYSQNQFSHWESRLSMNKAASCWAASGMTLLTELGKTEEEVLSKIESIRENSSSTEDKGEKYDTLIKCSLLEQSRVFQQTGLKIENDRPGVDLKTRIKKYVSLSPRHIKGLIEHSFYSDANHTLYFQTSGSKNNPTISIWNPSGNGRYGTLDEYITAAKTKYGEQTVKDTSLSVSYYK